MTRDAWVEDKPPETCRLVTPLRVNPVKAPACDAASGPLPGPRVSLPPAQFEFMIESILYARDAWLKEDGAIWPTTAAPRLVPCSADKDYRSKVLFWDNAYEFNLSALK